MTETQKSIDINNYLEILNISEQDAADPQKLEEQYDYWKNEWQAIASTGVGERQKIARLIEEDQLVDEAYETLRDPERRKRWLEEFKLRKEGSSLEGLANLEINFSLSGGHTDYRFNVIENPVRTGLAINNKMRVESIPEYVIRAWEDESILESTINTRRLERWLRYSAGEVDIANRVQYALWEPRPVSFRTIGFSTLDLLQSRYPIPILPKSSPKILEKIREYREPTWMISPNVVDFGLIPGKSVSRTIVIKHWKTHPGKINVSIDSSLVQVDQSGLNLPGQYSQVVVSVDGSQIERGKWLRASLTISSDVFGSQTVKVVGARFQLSGNDKLRREVSSEIADEWHKSGNHENASEMYRLAGRQAEAKQSEFEDIRNCFERNEWELVISKTRDYHRRYGREKQTLIWRIEALRMVGAAYYQLAQYIVESSNGNLSSSDIDIYLRRRKQALPYIAAIAYETSKLDGEVLPDDCWTANPTNSQVYLPVGPCLEQWIETAEAFNLQWTHAEGLSNRSKYAGNMPINLGERLAVWRSGSQFAVKAPLVAYKGILVARTKDNTAVVGLSAASGKILWRYSEGMGATNVAEPVAGTPESSLESDNPQRKEGIPSVFITDGNSRVHRLNIRTGEPIWSTQALEHARDLDIVLFGSKLFVGTGRQILIFNAIDGRRITQSKSMTTLGAGVNPLNMMVANDRCLFQINQMMGVKSDGVLGAFSKLAGVNLESPAIMQLDEKTGEVYKATFPEQFNGHAISPAPPFAWAAAQGTDLVFMASEVTYTYTCKVRDSQTNQTRTSRDTWARRFLTFYNMKEGKIYLADEHNMHGQVPGQRRGDCNLTHVAKSANAITVAPVEMAGTAGNRLSIAPITGSVKEPGLIIAAAFGNAVFYWMLKFSDGKIKFIGRRRVSGQVQSIIFAGATDLVVSSQVLSTSVAGSTNNNEATTYQLGKEVGNISGNPALFGDILYVVTGAGEVVAIAR